MRGNKSHSLSLYWTSHSLRLGAQALHKMSIDKFSSTYATHAQFESHWWGRKRRLFHFGFPLLMKFLRQTCKMCSTSGSRAWRRAPLSWQTACCEGNVTEMVFNLLFFTNQQKLCEYPCKKKKDRKAFSLLWFYLQSELTSQLEGLLPDNPLRCHQRTVVFQIALTVKRINSVSSAGCVLFSSLRLEARNAQTHWSIMVRDTHQIVF